MNDKSSILNLADDTGSEFNSTFSKEKLIANKFFLKGSTIGISISESDNLSELGYGIIHLKDVIIELARYMLATGAKLAYGGDMRPGGFTELIFDLLLYYKADKALAPQERFISYLAHPVAAGLTIDQEARLKQNVTFKRIKPPVDVEIEDMTKFLKSNNPENRYKWGRCLTEMREELNKACQARIFVGGRAVGFKGKMPGILEEILIALANSTPVYLLGAFGGITKDIIDALKGQSPISISNEFQFQNTDYTNAVEVYNRIHPADNIDYDKYMSRLHSYGLKEVALHNGLTDLDNLRLTQTPHIHEMVFLILKGLSSFLLH